MQKDNHKPIKDIFFANDVQTHNTLEHIDSQQTQQESAFTTAQDRQGDCSSLNENAVDRMDAVISDPSQSFWETDGSEYVHESHSIGSPASETSTLCSGTDSIYDLEGSGLRLPRCKYARNPEVLQLLVNSLTQPPIRKDTLSELDLVSVQNNLNLRIDLNYDFDLYFQPISGVKGQRKQREALDYFKCIAIELDLYRHGKESDCDECIGVGPQNIDLFFQPRLKLMLRELRLLLEVLVPDSNHVEVHNHLDVGWLMHQVSMGALDIVGLTRWVHGLLTLHCAPIRDELADEMMEDIEIGVYKNDTGLLVEGLSKLFTLCEAMKLDVVNHQVRTFRLPLVRDTIPFQIDCFTKLKENGQIEVDTSKDWYDRECDRLRRARYDRTNPPAMECFIYAMARLCGNVDSMIPETFHYDKQRFRRLQEELQNIVQLRICVSIFDVILSQHRLSYNRTACHHRLSLRIMQITEDEDNETEPISDHLDEVSLEIARAAFDIFRRSRTIEFRTTDMPDIYLKQVSTSLRREFERERSSQKITRRHIEELSDLSWKQAIHFSSLSTLDMSNEQRQWTQNRGANDQQALIPDLEDIARRVAHMGVLNWRVWSELVYLNNET